MTDHRDHREALGAYVLGALEPDERHVVEAHLGTCPACRDEVARLSALPHLLDHLDEGEAADATLVPPPGLGARVATTSLLEGTRLRRQVRAWRAATGLAAAAALVVVVLWSPWSDPAPTFDRWVLDPSHVAGGVEGTAAALAWEWGTTVELDLEALPPADRYVVWAIAEDGRREQAGTWGRTASGRATVRGASAIQRTDLHQIEVTALDGPVLATFDVHPPETG